MHTKLVGGLFVGVLFFSTIAYADEVTEKRVRDYFVDTPVMIEIARCESKFRQYTDAGNPFYGGMGGLMVGVYQIHTTVHQSYAKSLLGYDILTLEGNLGYARYLYQTEGTKPWASSYACWGNSTGSQNSAPETAAAVSGASLTANLTFGMVHSQVKTLQKILNQRGFIVAIEGPGSSGQETDMFGSLTRAAVRKFQCATINVCSGETYTTGYGRVGPMTRAALTPTSTPGTTQAASPSALASTTTASTSTPSTTPSGGSGSSYTPAQSAEVDRLQAQIEELTKFIQLYQTGEEQP